jgi:GntR family transcriptional regulator/MocR family aminotransferase
MARSLAAPRAKTLAAHLPLAIANITLDLSSPVPLYEQVARALRVAVESGELPPATPMPRQYELAAVLGVGRNTVVAAYSRLVAEGYLVAHKRRGTRVADRGQMRGGESARISQGPGLIDLGYHAKRALDISIMRTGGAQPFALHAPDPVLYPRAQLGKLIAEEMRHVPSSESGYGARGACSAFQAAIASHLRNARGVHCEPDQIIPVAGVESVLDIVARALIDPGHAVHVEDPAADIVRSAFLSAGARLYPLTQDTPGAEPARAETPPPRLIFTSPTISFPFGRQMPEAQRLAILQFARVSGAAIFEADTYGELVYAGGRQRAIQGHDREGRVFYFGSLSRTLGPGVRVSYLVVPPALVESFSEIVRRVAYGPEIFLQSAITKFIVSGQYALHIKAIRGAYARRLQALIEACRRHISGATVLEPDGGLHLSLLLDDTADEGAICRLAVQEDLQVAPLSHFYLNPARRRGLVLGFGSLADRAIDETVGRLGSLIRQVNSFNRE